MSYAYNDELNTRIAELVANDFDGSGFDVNEIEGTLNVTARLSVDLPDGWEFTGYHDTIEIEKSVNF